MTKDVMTLEEAAIKIQGMFRVRMARKRLRALLKAVVERFYDEDSGLYYYYNTKTGESTWIKPTLLGTEDANLGAMYNTDKDNNDVQSIVQDDETPSKEEIEAIEGPIETTSPVKAVESTHEEPIEPETTEVVSSARMEEKVDEVKGAGNETEQVENIIGAFTQEELVIIEEQFKKFDKDNSGSITSEEMLAIMHAFGDTSSLTVIQKMIKDVDTDGNGEVNLNEFIAILQRQRQQDSHCASLQLAMLFGPDEISNLRKQFQKLDTDNSGEIDERELGLLMKGLGQTVTKDELRNIIQEVDRNNNGTIDFNEFCHIVYNMRNTHQTKFAALLHLGIAKGLLKDLGHVMNATKTRVVEWWNADKIAEAKRLEAKRQRQLERQRLIREQEERERKIFQDELTRLANIEKERWAVVDGLRHQVDFEGDKENYPNKGQYARVHYTAMFENGKVFEASRTRGGAFEFKVGAGHVIQGWDIAIQRMSVGETATITCAPTLAYGIRGRPPKIPPNATLMFKVELIAIHEKIKMDQGVESDNEDS